MKMYPLLIFVTLAGILSPFILPCSTVRPNEYPATPLRFLARITILKLSPSLWVILISSQEGFLGFPFLIFRYRPSAWEVFKRKMISRQKVSFINLDFSISVIRLDSRCILWFSYIQWSGYHLVKQCCFSKGTRHTSCFHLQLFLQRYIRAVCFFWYSVYQQAVKFPAALLISFHTYSVGCLLLSPAYFPISRFQSRLWAGYRSLPAHFLFSG